MQRNLFLLFILAPLSVGCRTTVRQAGAEADSMATDTAKVTDDTLELETLQRNLIVAQSKLELAKLESESFEREHEAKARLARAEIAIAKANVDRFREAEAPTRLASANLNMSTTRDRAQEATDELKQIEIMYDEQDLDDMTAEFVVSRGRRNAERAAKRIEIQESELRALEQRELPIEEQRLTFDVDKAAAKLAELELAAEVGRRKKAIAVNEAENALAKIESEIRALKAKAKS